MKEKQIINKLIRILNTTTILTYDYIVMVVAQLMMVIEDNPTIISYDILIPYLDKELIHAVNLEMYERANNFKLALDILKDNIPQIEIEKTNNK